MKDVHSRIMCADDLAIVVENKQDYKTRKKSGRKEMFGKHGLRMVWVDSYATLLLFLNQYYLFIFITSAISNCLCVLAKCYTLHYCFQTNITCLLCSLFSLNY